MRLFQRALLTLLTLGLLLSSAPSAAETNPPPPQLPSQIENIFALLEQLGLDKVMSIPGLNLPGTIALAGCVPALSWSGLSVDFRFLHTPLCAVDGTVRLGVLPMRAEVRLQIYGTPGIEAVDFDAQMMLRRRNGALTLNYQILNGRVAVRPLPTMGLQEYYVTALGVRERNGRSLSVNSRMNLFERQSLKGYSLVRQITKSGETNTRNVQICSLAGGEPANPNGGTLSLCRAINR